MSDLEHISLSQLNGIIREAIEMNFLDEIWLVAEIAEMRVAGAGHCYLDLVERKSNKIVARMRANIWKFQYDRIASSFFSVTGVPLQKGMKVLFSVSISFHVQYGISLVVKNIDPSYSLGDLERKKKEIIKKLSNEGLMGLNSQITLELVPKKIAVISSETAAGYGDFINQINNNSQGFLFETQIFQSVMQGEAVEQSVIGNIDKIEAERVFDCIVIIRGGGASLDLAGFDNYEIGKKIAQCSLPVLTGIGHERDETIADMVSHTKLKTPTAAAEFLIEKMQSFEDYYLGLKEALVYFTRERVNKNKALLRNLSHETKSGTQKILEQNRIELTRIKSQLPLVKQNFIWSKKKALKQSINTIRDSKDALFTIQKRTLMQAESVLKIIPKQIINKQKSELKLFTKTIQLIHPENVLKRGYAMVYKDNEVVTGKSNLKLGDEVQLKLRDGIVKSKIIE
jgi:exodeoxyribonuclease VII large subunit